MQEDRQMAFMKTWAVAAGAAVVVGGTLGAEGDDAVVMTRR